MGLLKFLLKIFFTKRKFKLAITNIKKDSYVNKQYLLRKNRRSINYIISIALKIDNIGKFAFTVNANPTVQGELNILSTSANTEYDFIIRFLEGIYNKKRFKEYLAKQYEKIIDNKGKTLEDFPVEIFDGAYKFGIPRRVFLKIRDPGMAEKLEEAEELKKQEQAYDKKLKRKAKIRQQEIKLALKASKANNKDTKNQKKTGKKRRWYLLFLR